MIKLHDDRPLDKRSNRNHAGAPGHLPCNITPPIHQSVVGNKKVSVKADHLALQLPLEPRHDRHHEDQDGDPQRHTNH